MTANLNGLYILLMVILAAVCFVCGYLQGQVSTVKKLLKDLKELQKKLNEISFDWTCPECGEKREGDERVRAGMKCGYCAY